LPVPAEPQHAAAEAPVARTAGDHDAVEPELAHLRPQSFVAPRVLLRRELLVDGVAVVGRAVHAVEGLRLVEAVAKVVPGKRGVRGDGHGPPLGCKRLPVMRTGDLHAAALSANVCERWRSMGVTCLGGAPGPTPCGGAALARQTGRR